MTEPNLLVICVTAFFAVLLLLSLLAGVIRLLTTIFPEQSEGVEPPVLAAITAAVAAAHPNARITRVEEIR